MNLTNSIFFVFKWMLICVLIGVISGLASAFFLVSLEWVTQFREQNNGLIWLLPIAGLFIGWFYYQYGANIVKGNNVLLEEYENPQKTIPLKMAPIVLFSTLITHLFGGSAGREGTAVQMGGAIADQCTQYFKLDNSERKTVILLGISAGFASIFGTPLAGAIFALEVLYFSKINSKSILLSFVVAYIAFFTVEILEIQHTHYYIPETPTITTKTILWVVMIGIVFGLTAMLFSRTTHFFGTQFSKRIKYPPLRPLVGGLIVVIAIYLSGTTKFIGLGIPSIVQSFHSPSDSYDFFFKIVFTAITLSSGFKGGEVTPLFFIGATLGSALSLLVPLPIGILAGMGFVAVFSGATHTPIACTVMGIELFGLQNGFFVGLACLVAYFCSGPVGIYHSQIVRGAKYHCYQRFKKMNLRNF